MSFCTNCGKEIIEGSKFCSSCGTAVAVAKAPVAEAPVVETPVVETPVAETPVAEAPVVETPVAEEPVVAQMPVAEASPMPTFAQNIDEDYLIKEEQEFLDGTHRLLRWEKKALSICGTIMMILGIVVSAISFIMIIVSAVEGDEYAASDAASTFVTFTTYIVSGIVQKVIAGKIPLYIGTIYDDFTFTRDRSGSVGMLILQILFGQVGFVFFLINFIRIKSNSAIINRILARQGKI